MLDPARLRENLAEFLLHLCAHTAVFGKHDGAGAGGALVEGEDVFHIIVFPRLRIPAILISKRKNVNLNRRMSRLTRCGP